MSRSENTRVAECIRRARRDDRASRSEGVGATSTRTPLRSHLNHRGRGAHCDEGGLIVSRPNAETAKRPSPELADRPRQVFIGRELLPWGLDLSVGADGRLVGVTVSVASADLGLALASIAGLTWGVVAALMMSLASASSAAETVVVVLDGVNERVTASWRTPGMRKGALAGEYARAAIDHATPIAELATRMAYAA